MGRRVQVSDFIGTVFSKSLVNHSIELERLETRCLLNGAFNNGVWSLRGDIDPADRSDEIVIDVDPDDSGLLRAIINDDIINGWGRR